MISMVFLIPILKHHFFKRGPTLNKLFLILALLSAATLWSCRPQVSANEKSVVDNQSSNSQNQKSYLNDLKGTWESACDGDIVNQVSEKSTFQISEGTINVKFSKYGYDSKCQGKVVWQQIITHKFEVEGPSKDIPGAINIVGTLQEMKIMPLIELAAKTLQESYPSAKFTANEFTILEVPAKQMPYYSVVKIVSGKLCQGVDTDNNTLPTEPAMRAKSLNQLIDCATKIME